MAVLKSSKIHFLPREVLVDMKIFHTTVEINNLDYFKLFQEVA